MRFSLVALYSSEMHYKLVDSKQNRCMKFLVAKHLFDIIVFFLSEIYVRILISTIELVSI